MKHSSDTYYRIPNEELPESPVYGSRYFGDGDDRFSKTEWERELWSLVRETYIRKYEESRKLGIPALYFNPPDYVTLVECEEKLESLGVVRTYR
jgi:hypothetical protein